MDLLNNYKPHKDYINKEQECIEFYRENRCNPEVYDILITMLVSNPDSVDLKNKVVSYIISYFNSDADRVEIAHRLLQEIITTLNFNDDNMSYIVSGNYAEILRFKNDPACLKYYEMCLNSKETLKDTYLTRQLVNKFGSMLHKFNKLNKERELYKKYVDLGYFDNIYHRPEIVYTNSPLREPFINPTEINFSKELENNYLTIKNELLEQINHDIGAWDEAYLTEEHKKWKLGSRHTDNR